MVKYYTFAPAYRTGRPESWPARGRQVDPPEAGKVFFTANIYFSNSKLGLACPPKVDLSASGGKTIVASTVVMPCVYVIRSSITNKNYVGSSKRDDPKYRLLAHNSSKNRSTKHGRPWQIIHSEFFQSYDAAYAREKFFKSGVGRKWIFENFQN